MVSVIEMDKKWYAVCHSGDHLRSDLTNVISSYEFNSKIDAELFSDGVLKPYKTEVTNGN